MTLQALALMVAKKQNSRCCVWPAAFHGLRDFTAVEMMMAVPNMAARIVLSVLYPHTSCIAGGYGAYKCGLTTQHGDIDVFIGVSPGRSLQVAKEIARYLSCVRCIPVGTGPVRIYPSRKSPKYVVKVPALLSVHPSYVCNDTVSCDIVVVEIDTNLDNKAAVICAIVDEFDLDVCRCVGVPIQQGQCWSEGEGCVVFTPVVFGSNIMKNLCSHRLCECPLLHEQILKGFRNVYLSGMGGPELRKAMMRDVYGKCLRHALVQSAVAHYHSGYFSGLEEKTAAAVKCYMCLVGELGRSYAQQHAIKKFEDELLERIIIVDSDDDDDMNAGLVGEQCVGGVDQCLKGDECKNVGEVNLQNIADEVSPCVSDYQKPVKNQSHVKGNKNVETMRIMLQRVCVKGKGKAGGRGGRAKNPGVKTYVDVDCVADCCVGDCCVNNMRKRKYQRRLSARLERYGDVDATLQSAAVYILNMI